MPLTPKEIEQKTFSASFRGYAEDEVDVFLEEVIVSVSEYQQMIRERDAMLANGEAPPATAPAQPTTVVEDVAGANEEANRILQAARRQADQLIADAQAQAAEIEAAASSTAVGAVFTADQAAERERLIQGYQRLKGELAAVRARVQKALTASEEAFGIMEGQVGSVLDAAAPDAAVATPAVPEVAELPSEQPEEAEEIELQIPADLPPGTADGVSDRPRRPWER